MIKYRGIMFLDGGGCGPEQPTVHTYREGETWYVVKSGPSYVNTYRVVEYDEDGLRKLEAAGVKE